MKVQTRRKFLTGLIAGTASLAAANQTLAENVKYSIKTTEDIWYSYVIFNPERAKKARKLAEYVIKEEKLPLKYDSRMSVNSLMQVVEVELIIENVRYDVRVMNYNKNRFRQVDSITIKSRMRGAKESEATIVQDRGLDGRCDYGAFPRKAKELKLEGAAAKMLNADFDLERPGSFGTKHQKKFQEIYEKCLDALIRFYERKSK